MISSGDGTSVLVTLEYRLSHRICIIPCANYSWRIFEEMNRLRAANKDLLAAVEDPATAQGGREESAHGVPEGPAHGEPAGPAQGDLRRRRKPPYAWASRNATGSWRLNYPIFLYRINLIGLYPENDTLP